VFHSASVSKQNALVNSQNFRSQLAKAFGVDRTNERAQPATKTLDFAECGSYKGRTATRDEPLSK